MTSSARALTVMLLPHQWMPVDGTLDNSVAIDSVNGDDTAVAAGLRVREAGWAAMRAAPEINSIGWPADESFPMAITATRSDWQFVLEQVDRWHQVGASLGESEEDSAVHAAREAITTALSG